MRSRRRQLPLCVLTLAVVAASGCEEPKNVAGKPPAPAPAPPKDNFIVGKKTQEIGKFDPNEEIRKGGAVSNFKITARDPITLSGNAYVTSIGKISVDQMDYAVKLFQAENDRFPKDYQEFMDEIIKKNNIALPKLPFYQEYKYDEVNHKLLVIEYPEKKAGPLPQ
jgi:hypothetical protein